MKSKKSKQIIIALKYKKCFFLRTLTKMPNSILCFSEIPKIFICVDARENWKKLYVWSSILSTVSTLEICERKAYRK